MAIRQLRSDNLVICRYYGRSDTLERLQKIYGMLNDLEKSGYIRVVDAFPVFCPEEICRYTDDSGTLLYRDIFSHASVDAAKMSRPIFFDWLKEIDPKASPRR
jgi:hypothetical protein